MKIRLSYQVKLILAVVLATMLALSGIAAFLLVNIRGDLQSYELKNMENSLAQTSERIDTHLSAIMKVFNYIYANSELFNRLEEPQYSPLDFWKLYHYVDTLFENLMILDSNISLISLFVPNEAVIADKKYIRDFSEFEALTVYPQLQAAQGAISMHRMGDVFDDGYFYLNNASNPDNFCVLSLVNFRGESYGVCIEIPARLFSSIYSRLETHTLFLCDPSGVIQLAFINGVRDTAKEGRQIEAVKPPNFIHADQTLALGWQVVMGTEPGVLFKQVDGKVYHLMLFSALLIFVALCLVLAVTWKTSSKLSKFKRLIGEVSDEFGERLPEEPGNRDEIDLLTQSFTRLIERIRFLMNTVYQQKIKNQSMELKLLYSQIKPHFLYNTLSSILSLSRKYHDTRLENMISSLSSLYRTSLNRGKDNITISEEIQITNDYIYIMMNRFAGLIEVGMDIPAELHASIIPKVLLQPFIENAINHAMTGDSMLHIGITAERMAEDIVFTITDDGKGITQQEVDRIFNTEDSGNGYGVRNVHQRLCLLFGEGYGVTLNAGERGGTVITIRTRYQLSE